MEIMRIVVAGPVGSGKSSLIRTVSEIEPVDTDRRATDVVGQLKRTTTVAMDFGRLQFGPNVALHLYGTPGQERFNFMWDILIQKAHAFVLLVSSHRPQDFLPARRILVFMRRRTQVPMVIGLSHADRPNAWPSEEIAVALGYLSPHRRPPMVSVNALDRRSVLNLIKAVIETYATEQARELQQALKH